jgi:hypothetical protein
MLVDLHHHVREGVRSVPPRFRDRIKPSPIGGVKPRPWCCRALFLNAYLLGRMIYAGSLILRVPLYTFGVLFLGGLDLISGGDPASRLCLLYLLRARARGYSSACSPLSGAGGVPLGLSLSLSSSSSLSPLSAASPLIISSRV